MGSPGARRWYVLGIMTLVYALNQADRFMMSSLLEPIKRDLNLSDTGVGFLSGVALALFYVAAGLPIAALADRSNRRNIVTASLAIWSGMTALCGLTRTYVQLLLVRIGVGIGEAGGTAPSHALLSDLFPARQRPQVFAIFGAGASLGVAAASWGSWLSERIGWRPVFFVFGIPGIFLALLIRMTVAEPSRGAADPACESVKAGLFDTLRYIGRESCLRHQMWASFSFCLASWGLLWWLPAYLVRSHGMTVGQAGALLGWMHGIGGTGGLIASVVLMRWLESRSLQPARAAAVLVFLATVPALIAVITHDTALTTAMLWVFITIAYGLFGPTFSLLHNTSPPAMRSQMSAICLLVINVANLVIAPLGVGWVSDSLAPEYGNESLRVALIGLSLFGFVGAYHFWACARDLRGAMQRAGTREPSLT
jgi:predicted MFS family arabinose efflux permease